MDSRPLRVLSAFAGFGGLDLGVGRALARLGVPHRTVLYVERDVPACRVLASRMADGGLCAAPVWSDVRTVPDMVRADLVHGGFPCQDLSVAGKRAGIGAARSGLFFDLEALARRVGARFLFLENVAGIVGGGHGDVGDEGDGPVHGWLGAVLGALAEGGWDAEWACLRAADVGAPHRRERWFCLAWRDVADAERGGRLKGHRSGGLEGRGRLAQGDGGIDVADPERRMSRPERGECEPTRRELGAGSDALPPWPPGPDDADGWRRVLAVRPDLAPAVGNPAGQRRHVREAHRCGQPAGVPRTGSDRNGTGSEEPQPGLRRVAHGLPDDVALPRADALRGYGNACVPAQAEAAFLALWERMTW